MDTDNQSAPVSEEVPASGFGGVAQAIGSRNLIIVILVMPVIFIGGLFAILFMTGKLGGKLDAPSEAAAVVEPAVEGRAGAPVVSAAPDFTGSGQGAAGIALDGDRLAVRFDGPDGAEVIVYDLAQERVVARIFLAPGVGVSAE